MRAYVRVPVSAGAALRARLHPFALALACSLALTVLPAHAAMELYRADLHAHTAYSDGDLFGNGGPTAQSPTTAATAAKLNGLNAFSVSDHGEYLSPDKWSATISQMQAITKPGAVATAGTFIGLWGFEWTHANSTAAPQPGGSPGTGHINVYGSATSTGAADRGAGLTDKTVTAAVYWHHYWDLPSTGQSLYKWILDHKSSPLGSTIVAQINHPNFYPGATLANPTVNFGYDWWRKLEWVPLLDNYICLMEVGSHAEPGSRAATNYFGASYNEPYFQLALDNGWHVGPTNNEDNHTDSYGAVRTTDNMLTDTGVWCPSTVGMTPQMAQAWFLGSLRARRVFAAEDKGTSHAGAISLKFTVTPAGMSTLWMGSKNLNPDDVRNKRCRLEVTRNAGLLLNGGLVQVITNRGAVAKTLPTSGAGVTIKGNTATWDFSLDGDPVSAQLRAVNTAVASGIQQRWDIKPLPDANGPAPQVVYFDASPSGRIERYYYIRVQQSDGSVAISAPVWLKRTVGVIGGVDGVKPARAINAMSYTWDFGDGTVQKEDFSSAPDGQFDGITKHTYVVSGNYYPRVTVRYASNFNDVSICRAYVGSGTPGPFYGDVNGDGQINREDIRLLAQIVAGVRSADAGMYARGNVVPAAGIDPTKPGVPGGTSKLDMADLLRLYRFLSGKEKSWP